MLVSRNVFNVVSSLQSIVFALLCVRSGKPDTTLGDRDFFVFTYRVPRSRLRRRSLIVTSPRKQIKPSGTHFGARHCIASLERINADREFNKTTTATGTSLNKRFNEQNNHKAVLVCHKSLYISLPSSAKQQREMT